MPRISSMPSTAPFSHDATIRRRSPGWSGTAEPPAARAGLSGPVARPHVHERAQAGVLAEAAARRFAARGPERHARGGVEPDERRRTGARAPMTRCASSAAPMAPHSPQCSWTTISGTAPVRGEAARG